MNATLPRAYAIDSSRDLHDNASRLTSVTQPGLPTETYTWHGDSTLASLPGPSGTRNLEYDEEGQLRSIKHGSTTKFEFMAGFDGARRWSKDVSADRWDWFPCGVQCSAGELVEMTSTLAGSSWTTSATNLARSSCGGPGLVRSGSQWVLPDLFGRVRLAMSSSGSTVASAVFDSLGVQRFGTGTLASGVIRNTYGSGDEDGLNSMLHGRDLVSGGIGPASAGLKCSPGEIVDCILTCGKKGRVFVGCVRIGRYYKCICVHPILVPPCPPFC